MSYIYTTRRKPKNGKVLPPELKGKFVIRKNKIVRKRKKPRKTYSQNWPVYNSSQTKQKMMFLHLLNDAVDSLDIKYKYQGNGRPHYPLDDMIKCCAIKVFNNFSSRRTMFELQVAHSFGYIRNVPHFNSINNYMENPLITAYIHRLYKKMSDILIDTEHVFATDSTGFSLPHKEKWAKVAFEKKYRIRRSYKKLHIIIGVKTKIITSAIISKGTSNDSPYFEALVRDTAERFRIYEISADAGYLSRNNCRIAEEVGAQPFIQPKKNSSARAYGVPAWHKMIRHSKDDKKDYDQRYHKRSNVETAFAMIKMKFLQCVRSKTLTAQQNELLFKVVCHNASVLIECLFELGIDLNFNK